MFEQLLSSLSAEFQTAIAAVLTALITATCAVFISFLNAMKNKALRYIENLDNEKVQRSLSDAVNHLEHVAETVVMSIEQEEKQNIVQMLADGKVDSQELYALRALAVTRIKAQLNSDTMQILEGAYGDVGEYIADVVSRKVLELKQFLNK